MYQIFLNFIYLMANHNTDRPWILLEHNSMDRGCTCRTRQRSHCGTCRQQDGLERKKVADEDCWAFFCHLNRSNLLLILLREVTPEEGEKRAKELNTMFIETSAKAGHNVGGRVVLQCTERLLTFLFACRSRHCLERLLRHCPVLIMKMMIKRIKVSWPSLWSTMHILIQGCFSAVQKVNLSSSNSEASGCAC